MKYSEILIKRGHRYKSVELYRSSGGSWLALAKCKSYSNVLVGLKQSSSKATVLEVT
jgi:hypothetical protein